MKTAIPKFQTKEEAALFWENHEILDYIDPAEFETVDPKKVRRYSFADPKGKRERQLISLRVDTQLLERAKVLSARRRVGYQSILRNWLEKGASRKAA